MSCYYSLYCVTCEADSGIQLNHGADHLRELWADREFVVRNGASSGVVDVTVSSALVPDLPVWFFREHCSHEVRIRDEYGRFDDDCGERITCACCDTRVWCRLPMGHSGDHAPKRRAVEAAT